MIKVISYGGGVQSTALLVLAAMGKIDYQTFLFCNVGEDSENPETLAYVEQIAKPYALAHGLELIELQRTFQDGRTESLYEHITKPGSRSIDIPIRMSNGAPGNRTCTVGYKIKVVDKWLREHDAKKQGAMVALGISLDEFHRARNDSGISWKKLAYPLLDLRLDRQDCTNIIQDAGLPIPPKSSCYFCPFHRLSTWQEMRHSQPELFKKACDLETFINERRRSLGRDSVWFTDRARPLSEATTDYQQGNMFEDDQAVCESGYCMV